MESSSFYAPQKKPSGRFLPSVGSKGSITITFKREKNETISHLKAKPFPGTNFIKGLHYLKQPHFFGRLFYLLKRKFNETEKDVLEYISPIVQIERHKGCVLECSGCLLGLQNKTGYPQKIALTNIDIFKKEIDQFHKKRFQVHFHLQSNPLLNEVFYEACDYAASKGLWTVMHCNIDNNCMTLPDHLPSSNIRSLEVCIDSESHSGFREPVKGGELDVTFKRIREIADEKKRTRSRFPLITLKVLAWNPSLAAIRFYEKMAIASGANEVIFERNLSLLNHPVDHSCKGADLVLDRLDWEPVSFPEQCPFHWQDLQVNADGKLSPVSAKKTGRTGFLKSALKVVSNIAIVGRELLLTLAIVPIAIFSEKFK